VLTIHVSFMVKYVNYMGIGSNGCSVACAALTSNHYRTYVISGVGHPRSDLVVLLVLCTVACNGWGMGIVLQVHQDSANPAKNE
jgi:hypothetical protein